MIVKVEHNGYTLQWSDGGIKDGFGGYFVYKDGKPVLHATTDDTPLTEEKAREILSDMPEFLEMLRIETPKAIKRMEAKNDTHKHR